MNWTQDLTLHVDALLAAMESDKKFFASVSHYVKELKRLLDLPGTEVSKSSFVTPATKIKEFWDSYKSDNRTPGFVYIPPARTSNTQTTVDEIYSLVTKLTTLPDDQFASLFRPALPSGGSGAKGARQSVRSRLYRSWTEQSLGTGENLP